MTAGSELPPHGRRTVRGIQAAGAVLALATGVVGLSAIAAPPAQALPAPSHEGWDGSRYWFKSDGQWRWTSHHSVYLQRTHTSGSSSPSPSPSPSPASKPASKPATKPATTGKSGTTGTSAVERAVDYALAQLGKPYIWGGNGPAGYDCSGLVQQAYQRAGISLPRVAAAQYGAVTKIGAGSLRRGDLLFWSSNKRQSGIGHVAVYLGDGRYVEAPRPGRTIRVSVLSSGYYPTFFGRP
ncbi:C40 family peptidase [Streptomyces sp. NPDC004629]|uniref:C40 family peptidase n=1 Tax=Streptomyces sp. NPDC004629 TaxID=3364705 RepID=UPI0036863E24